MAVASGPEALKGKPLPAFKMTPVSGGPLSSSALKGKVVILDFWATWCAPCVAASPTMQKLYSKYSSQGLVVIGSNITDTPAAIKAYMKKHGYTYPFSQGNEEYSKKLGVQAIPVFVFVDRKGVVQRVDTGFSGSSPAEWEATVKSLLAKK